MTLTVGSTTPSSGGILTAAGVGSGLDVNGLVSQLVAAKKAPEQNRIDFQKAAATTQLSALGQVTAALAALRSALSSLKDGTALNRHTATVADATVLGASAGATAINGSYSVDVTQLAAAMKASSGAFTDSSTVVGTGTLTIAVGSSQMSLAIDASHASLASIRDAINGASDSPGVSATIVTGTDGAHLVLRSTETGAANAFTVSSSGGDGGLAALDYDPAASTGNGLSVIAAAADATYTIDGTISGISAGNTVTTAIDGLTLNLATLGTTTVTVGSDSSSASSAVSNLVKTYNSFVGIYKSLTAYDSQSGSAGALLGDATLNSIKSTLANIVGGTANGSTLSAIGVSLQLDGTLSLDQTKLSAALADGHSVANLFTGTSGLASKLDGALDRWVGTDGILDVRSVNLNKQLTDLANSQTALDNRMVALTTRYTQQFTALDGMLAKLNNTSSYLTQQFDAMQNAYKK